MRIDTYEKNSYLDFDSLCREAEEDAVTVSCVEGINYPYLIEIHPNLKEGGYTVKILVFEKEIIRDCFRIVEGIAFYLN